MPKKEGDRAQNPNKILIYSTSHGFGHLTRLISLLPILLKSHNFIITLCCAPSQNHLLSFLEEANPNFFVRNSSLLLDPGVIQSDACSVDINATWDAHTLFLNNIDEKLDKEVAWLREEEFDICLIDSPPMPAVACKMAGLKCVIMTNFTFDSILSHLASTPVHHSIIERYKSAYASIHLLIRLPGNIPIPSCPTSIDVDLVHRPLLTPRDKFRLSLGIHPSTPVLFQCFGSWSLSCTSIKIPSHWKIISTTPLSHPSSITLPKDAYIPDLINASDVVLGKCGYGVCSECVAFHTPLIYVPRPLFVEEVGLVKLLDEHSLGLAMTREAYETGNWEDKVLQAFEMKRMDQRRKWVGDGASQVVEIVKDMIRGLSEEESPRIF